MRVEAVCGWKKAVTSSPSRPAGRSGDRPPRRRLVAPRGAPWSVVSKLPALLLALSRALLPAKLPALVRALLPAKLPVSLPASLPASLSLLRSRSLVACAGLVLSGAMDSGCTLVGYGVGRVADSYRVKEVARPWDTDIREGDAVRIQLLSGERLSGRVVSFGNVGIDSTLVLRTAFRNGSFANSKNDTLAYRHIVRVQRPGGMGNLTALGIFAGLIVDGYVIHRTVEGLTAIGQ